MNETTVDLGDNVALTNLIIGPNQLGGFDFGDDSSGGGINIGGH